MKQKLSFLLFLLLFSGLNGQHFLSKYVKNYPVSNYNSNLISSYIRLSNNHFLTTGRSVQDSSLLSLHKNNSVSSIKIKANVGFNTINHITRRFVRKANLLELNGTIYLNDMIGLYRIGPNLEFVQLLNQNNTGALIYNVKRHGKGWKLFVFGYLARFVQI